MYLILKFLKNAFQLDNFVQYGKTRMCEAVTVQTHENNSAADPLDGEVSTNPKGGATCYLVDFYRQLHENVENLAKRGLVPCTPYQTRQCNYRLKRTDVWRPL